MIVLYVIAIHIVIVWLLYDRTQQAERKKKSWIEQTTGFIQRRDSQISSSIWAFVGDSHVQGMCVDCVTETASANFGTGHATTEHVKNLIPALSSLRQAKAIIVIVGHNDIGKTTADVIVSQSLQIIKSAPTKVVWVGQIPVAANIVINSQTINSAKNDVNRQIKSLCRVESECTFVDPRFLTDQAGHLNVDYHVGDGIHLNTTGYKLLASEIRQALAALQ